MPTITRSELARLARLEQASRKPATDQAERSRFDWYGETCPCDLPPGECREHPRARTAQRPPADRSWTTFAYVAGRGAGKTQAAAGWIIDRVKRGVARNILLIAATAADIRDTVVE